VLLVKDPLAITTGYLWNAARAVTQAGAKADHDASPTRPHEEPTMQRRQLPAALFALSRDSRDEVDAMVEAAAKVGGTADIREAQDMGFMYLRSFADPDGNVFEPAWMDMSAMAGA